MTEVYAWGQFLERSPEHARTVAQCQSCYLWQGNPDYDSTLYYFRDAIGFVEFVNLPVTPRGDGSQRRFATM